MLRFPIYGFARRVDDTVARAMAILNTREDDSAGPQMAALALINHMTLLLIGESRVIGAQ